MHKLILFPLAIFASIPAFAGTLYSDIPGTDTNFGPETTSYANYANGSPTYFGSAVTLASGTLDSATVVLSNYAVQGQDTNSSYNINTQLLLWQVTGSGTGNSATGDVVYGEPDLTLVAQSDVTPQSIQYRPDAAQSNPSGLNCGAGNPAPYYDSQTHQYSCGQLNFLTFSNLNTAISGGTYVWSVGFAGDAPSAALNWALNNWCTDPAIGCDPNNPINPSGNPQYDTNYVGLTNCSNPAVFCPLADTGWSSIGQGEIAFTGQVNNFAPEPATLGLIGLGLLGIGFSVRGKSKKG